jgi:PAS domain S-box-containing protein
VLVEDVTEWKRAERELQRNQAQIAAVFAQATAGLAQTDLTGQFTLVNDRFCEIVGRTREDLLTIMMQDITAPEDVVRNLPFFRRAVENGEPFVIEKRYVRPDGSFVWVNNSVTAVRDEQGQATGVLAVSIDVTERKRTEEALRLQERTLRYTYEQAPVGICESDLHGKFTRVNPAFCRLVGYSEAELIGRNVAGLLWPDDIERDRQEIAAIISTERDSLRMEKRCRHKQGHAVWVELTASVIHDEEGRPISGIGVVQDISARKRALEELAGAKKQNEDILSSITESFIAVDRDWRFTYVNDRVVRRTGKSKEELIGRKLWDVFPEAANSPLWAAYHRCMEERVPAQFESPYPGAADKQAGWYEVHAYPTDEGICAYVLDITARKAAEEALAWQARLLDLSHEPILAWDLEDGSVRFWNHGAEIMYGWPGEDALGQMVHSLLRTRVPFDEVKRRLEETGTWVGELNHTTRDGRQLVMESRQELVREPGGRPLVLETNRDITDRKRADEALLASEAQLRRTSGQFLLAATAMRALVYDWDPASDQVERLRGFEELTGYHLDEVPSTAAWWREQIHPDDRASLDRTYRTPQDEIRVSEYRVRHKLGHYIWVRDAAMPLHDDFGVGRVVGCTVDISEQKHAELALQEREEFYRTLGEAVPDFIWTANKQGETLYANRRLCEYLGMSLEEINELGWRINHVDDIPEIRNRWNEAARLGQPFEAEYRYRRYDGTYRWFMGRAVPVKNAKGEIAQWIGTSTDIHRLKLAEESLRRYNEQLEEFAYAAAHDLQEPLRTVGIYVQLIERRLRDQLDEETAAYLHVVRENSERMGALVRDLLTYAQATDAPGETAPRTDCELVLNQVLANLESAIASTNTDVTVGDLPWVALHEAHLVQLFQNLLGNAIKYRSTERTPKVAISARPAEGAWVFTVADNGIGIRPEYRERVFGVFKRLHGRDVAGTGIGLAICKRIVEHYGGRIWVESDGDSGSTFCFTLPAALSESSSKRDS